LACDSRPLRRPKRHGSPPRPRRAADRQTLPMRLAKRRRDPELTIAASTEAHGRTSVGLPQRIPCPSLEFLSMSSSALLRPLEDSQLSEQAAETIARVRVMFGDDPIPESFFIYANAPAFLHDFYMNFKRFVLTAGKLDLKSKLLVAYSAAVVLGSRDWR